MAEKKKSKYYVRPDGLHESIRTINGKRVAFRGKTDREVDRKILEYREEAERGRKFPVIAWEWFATREADIGESTRKVYDISVRRLADAFPGYARELRPLDVERYIRSFERKGYASETVGKELTVFRQIMSYAVLNGDIDVSPVTEVKKSRDLPKTKRRALTEEQERKVLNCRTGDWWLLGYLLLFTGMRRGEALALTYDDIDRKAGVIHVTKKLNYAYGTIPRLEYQLKTRNSVRDVPLLKPLADVLPKNRIGLIFSENGEPIKKGRDTMIWRQYCRDAGLVEQEQTADGRTVTRYPVTMHCFRHTLATICFEANVDARSTAEILGDTKEIVEAVYQELREGKKRNSIDKLHDYFNNQQTKDG